MKTNQAKKMKVDFSIDIFNKMSLPVMICELPNYRIIHVNNPAIVLYGFPRDEFLNLILSDLRYSEMEPEDLKNYDSFLDPDLSKIIQTHVTKKREAIKVELISKKIVYESKDALLILINRLINKRSTKEEINEYAAILESTDDAIIGKTLDGIITSWNKGAEIMYDYTAVEVIGRSVEIIIPSEKINEFREIMMELKNGKRIEHLHTKRIKKDGSEITTSVTISPILDSAGNITGASAIAKDITQETLMQNIIRENSERMKLALMAGMMGTWDWKFTANTIEWDDYMYKIFGVEKDKFAGRFEDFLQLVHPLDREKVHKNVENAVEQNIPFESEYRIIGQDKGIRYIMARGKLLKNDAGILVGLNGICLDISDKKKAELEKDRLLSNEKKLRERADYLKQRLSFLADISLILSSSLEYETTLKTVAKTVVPVLADICAIDLIDDSGNLKRVEAAYSDSIKIKTFSELKEKFKTSSDIIKEVISSQKPKAIYKIDEKYLKQITEDEEQYSLLLKLDFKSALIMPLKSKEEVYGTLMLVMAGSGRYYNEEDLQLVEELAGRASIAIENANLYREAQLTNIELEKRVKKRTEELELLNKELETFSYSVSHDLRAPLRAIQGFSNILVDEFSESLNEEGKRLINVIISNAARMGNLIDDLLSFSRMTKIRLSYSEIDFNPMVREIFNEIMSSYEGQKIELKLEKLPSAFCDSSMLRQVWINLITNAVKFSSKKEKATIEIGSFKKNTAIVYFIKDNGVGFDMQYADKLFGVFQRLHKTTEFEGTGVGLAIIKKIISRHGGEVWAEAKINDGASFYFTLRMQNEQLK